MKIVDIANTIYENMGRPDSTSIPAIAFWVRSQIGVLNNLINEDFVLASDYEIVDGDASEISINAVAVLQSMYEIHKCSLDIRTNLNSLSTDSVVEVNDDGQSVRRVNKNEVAKTLVQMRKDLTQQMNDQVKGYKSNKTLPSQVAGDDTEEGVYPHTNLFSRQFKTF